MAKASIKQATVPATRRWPCSNKNAPRHMGKNVPKERGQSGTAKLEPVLVTKAPAKSNKAVQPAVKTANRWRLEDFWLEFLVYSMFSLQKKMAPGKTPEP